MWLPATWSDSMMLTCLCKHPVYGCAYVKYIWIKSEYYKDLATKGKALCLLKGTDTVDIILKPEWYSDAVGFSLVAPRQSSLDKNFQLHSYVSEKVRGEWYSFKHQYKIEGNNVIANMTYVPNIIFQGFS